MTKDDFDRLKDGDKIAKRLEEMESKEKGK